MENKTAGKHHEFCDPNCDNFKCNPNNSEDCVCETSPNLFVTLDYYDGYLAICQDNLDWE